MPTTNDDSNDPRHWRVRRRQLTLNADPWLRVWKEDLALPDERMVDGFFTIEMPDYVVIVATTAIGEILTQRGYKHGPRRVCTSLPAGFIEPGEEPLDGAKRELLEETGYVAREWELLGRFVNDDRADFAGVPPAGSPVRRDRRHPERRRGWAGGCPARQRIDLHRRLVMSHQAALYGTGMYLGARLSSCGGIV
jgi:hypothetical protein